MRHQFSHSESDGLCMLYHALLTVLCMCELHCFVNTVSKFSILHSTRDWKHQHQWLLTNQNTSQRVHRIADCWNCVYAYVCLQVLGSLTSWTPSQHYLYLLHLQIFHHSKGQWCDPCFNLCQFTECLCTNLFYTCRASESPTSRNVHFDEDDTTLNVNSKQETVQA